MPKLPNLKINPLNLVSIILLIVILAVVVFVFTRLKNENTEEKQAQETLAEVGIRSTFAGSVTSVDDASKTLNLKSTEDGSIYEVRLDPNGSVTADTQKIQFSEIKVGDQVAVYSKQSNAPSLTEIYIADLITKSVSVDINP